VTGVLGFLVRCEVCPQQAVVDEQLDGWMCPRCSSAGFGDVDVAQGEPLQEMRAADARVGRQLVDFAGRRLKSCPRPLTTPIDDPLAVAICAEVQRHPNSPMIAAAVDGVKFVMTSCTERSGQPFETKWANVDELPAKHILPAVPYSQPLIDAEVDGPDLGKIRG
jgi:hypothetical protein